MTTQPERDELDHLLDRAERNVLLAGESARLRELIRELEQRDATLTHMVTVAAQQIDALGTTLRTTL
ncbi:hypothetical protein [Streptomyces microflavus]|uniref:hypothetical protein n=1 Tax=Streptomyces microflavus TaxID=1919 RepID=UPI002E35C63C|nr:hypothetical protein [Streptomyces microflavus]